MARIFGIKNVAFLSTYPPRECGLATFTEDLVNEVSKVGLVRPCIIGVGLEKYEDPRVLYRLNPNERDSYLRTAQWANTYVDLLVIEHEYGIFGGESGEYILDLVKALKIPFIVTTHTVLLEPTEKQRTVLRDLGRFSTKVVTMAKRSIYTLIDTYGIESEKLVFIPHGVPVMQVESREKLKAVQSLQHQHVMSSFGLLSPDKGLEYGIEAVAKVAAEYKNLTYLILGKTHPRVKERMGEEYRHSLEALAQKLGVADNIRFVDKYLTKKEVITYLHMSDIYLTPYLAKEQAVSGTLAYAVGGGRVVISTPYPYAEEMLGEGRGLLARFRDADSLASCIRTVLANPVGKREMERKTLAVGRTMTWAKVASQYAELCMNITRSTPSLLHQYHHRLITAERSELRAGE